MVITKSTRDVLNFINDYGFITADICADIVYKNKSQAYNQASRKLKSMWDNKLIKRYRAYDSKKYIYVKSLEKKVSLHDQIIMKFYSKVYSLVDSIDYFKKEERWLNGVYRTDAHIIYTKDNRIRCYLVEVDVTHSTSQRKYDDIFQSNCVQKWYKDKYETEVFPRLLIISINGATKIKSSQYKVYSTNYDLLGLETLI